MFQPQPNGCFREETERRKLPWGKSNKNIFYREAVVAALEKRSGFFILDPRKLNPENPAAKESVDSAILWFATKEDFEDGLATIEMARNLPSTQLK